MPRLSVIHGVAESVYYLPCCFRVSLLVRTCVRCGEVLTEVFWSLQKTKRIQVATSPELLHHTTMSHLSADAKHHILLSYSPGERGRGFKALAARHGIAGGASLLSKWHRSWNGTPESLEEQPRSGRPRALSSAQVRRHIAAPLRNANRAARPVSYPALLPQVQAATHSNLSLSTLKRYGKKELHATAKKGKRRTAEERQSRHTAKSDVRCLVALFHPLFFASCFPLTFSVCRFV